MAFRHLINENLLVGQKTIVKFVVEHLLHVYRVVCANYHLLGPTVA